MKFETIVKLSQNDWIRPPIKHVEPSVSTAHTDRHVIAARTGDPKAFYCFGVRIREFVLGWQLNAYPLGVSDSEDPCAMAFVYTGSLREPTVGITKSICEEIPVIRYVRPNTAVRYRP